MLRLSIVGILATAMVLTAGCDTSGAGPFPGPGNHAEITAFELEDNSGLAAGVSVAVLVDWRGGVAPFTVSVDMGGGAEDWTVTADAGPVSRTVVLTEEDGGEFTAALQLIDGEGRIETGTFTYSYAAPPNMPPTINVVSSMGILTVAVADAEADDVTVTITDLVGGTATPLSRVVEGGSGTANFQLTAADLFAGGLVTGRAQVTDGISTMFEQEFSATLPAIGPSLVDSLYALPLQSTAAPGEPVLIVVATGMLPNPFYHLNGVRVTAPAGFEYVPGSFNVGAPGGDTYAVDGIWTALDPDGFMVDDQDFHPAINDLPADATGVAGRTGIDFGVFPLGGTEANGVSGALFNFRATFATGENRISFQPTQGVSRTYYTDASQAVEHFWGDISNTDVIANTVTVE